MSVVRNTYPETVIEVLDDEITYPDKVIRAMRRFAASHPWQGSIRLRKRQFQLLNRDFASACKIQEPTLTFGSLDGGSSGSSYYSPRDHRIMLTGKLSVVTFLHEFAHALGKDEQDACRWSINLFRKVFPRQYAGLIHVGHTLIRPRELRQRLGCENFGGNTRSKLNGSGGRADMQRRKNNG